MAPEVNLLVAASRSDPAHHPVARAWLVQAVAACANGAVLALLPVWWPATCNRKPAWPIGAARRCTFAPRAKRCWSACASRPALSWRVHCKAASAPELDALVTGLHVLEQGFLCVESHDAATVAPPAEAPAPSR